MIFPSTTTERSGAEVTGTILAVVSSEAPTAREERRTADARENLVEKIIVAIFFDFVVSEVAWRRICGWVKVVSTSHHNSCSECE
jgi:hypothetical protein